MSSYTAFDPFASPNLMAAIYGRLRGKTAYNVAVLGSRSRGWNSTAVLGDACDYLDTTQSLMNTPTTGQTLYLVSTSASDDAAGTGARSVRIVYLDAAGNQQTTTVNTAGLTPVSLGTGFSFIQWMEVASLGSSETSVGSLSISSTNGAATVATTFELIRAGGNRSLSGRYMVPTGFTAYVCQWGAAAINTTMDTRLRATVFADSGALSTVYHFQDRVFLPSGVITDIMLYYPALSAGCVIKVSAIPGNAPAGNKLDCDFHLLLIED